jgi:two-component system, LuxR family, sensor kinase FixL
MDFSLLESVPDAIAIVDRQAAIIYVNSVAEELFGYASDELLGKPVDLLIPVRFHETHHSDREGGSPSDGGAKRGAGSRLDVMVRLVLFADLNLARPCDAGPRSRPMRVGLDLFGLRKDGAEFPAEISLAPLRIGGETYAITAIRDLTERKKIEERARQYRKAKDEIRERDEFLSIASHELRTPVTALQLQLRLLQRAAKRSGESFREVVVGRLDTLERETQRITVLANELLDVSRIRLGGVELHLEPIDLGEVARVSVSRLQDELERSGSALTVAAGAPVRGDWDPLRIEQVLIKLVANAIKFGQGKPITVTVEEASDKARVAVSDHGIGIAPEHQDRVFGRFERATPIRNFGGFGLGLYIAREIVEAHGGTIQLQSAPGSGSTFTVELPRDRPISDVSK